MEHCTYYQTAEVKKKQENLDEKKWATRKCKNNKEKWEANCDGGGPSGVCLSLFSSFSSLSLCNRTTRREGKVGASKIWDLMNHILKEV